LDDGWRQAKEHFEEIRKGGQGDQITDWNIACCQIKLEDREGAMQTLFKRVESAAYIDKVLEGAIVLAFEFQQKRFLSQQLDWLPYEEAILLVPEHPNTLVCSRCSFSARLRQPLSEFLESANAALLPVSNSGSPSLGQRRSQNPDVSPHDG
jgi:hypothetical protein